MKELLLPSRRNALKYFALSPLSLYSNNQNTIQSKTVVILGGGVAGLNIANKLRSQYKNLIINIVENDSYAPTSKQKMIFVAGGILKYSQIQKRIQNHLPEDVRLIQAQIQEIDAKNNTVKLKKIDSIKYDYLIIAQEEIYDYRFLPQFKKILSLGTDTYSLFTGEGASQTLQGIHQLINKAAKHTRYEKLQVLFTDFDNNISAQEIMYLTHAHLVKANVRDKVAIYFYTNSENLCQIDIYNKVLKEQCRQKEFIISYAHKVLDINSKAKTILFEKEYDSLKSEKIEVKYDFLHVTPSLKDNKYINSFTYNKQTLQNEIFKNIWHLSYLDGSIDKQSNVILGNIFNKFQNKFQKFNGFKREIILTSIGKAIPLEYSINKDLSPSLPLHPTKERWLWWLIKLYTIKL